MVSPTGPSTFCPVCGTVDGACGTAHLSKPVIGHPVKELGLMANSEKVYLPRQHVRKGKAGWKNLPKNAVLYEGQKPDVAKGVVGMPREKQPDSDD